MSTSKRVPNPWLKLRSDSNVLSCDEPVIQQFNAYLRRYRLKNCRAICIRTDLLPEPFFGPFDAPVVLLLQNPGVDTKGRETRLHREPEFRQALIGSLRSTRGQAHFHLRHGEGPGYEWWTKAIKPLAQELEVEEEFLAKKLLCVEYFPYHSRSFDYRTPRVPSQEFTFQLVRDAMRNKALILCLRGELQWLGAVPSLGSYDRFCAVRSRTVLLSSGVVERFADLVKAVK